MAACVLSVVASARPHDFNENRENRENRNNEQHHPYKGNKHGEKWKKDGKPGKDGKIDWPALIDLVAQKMDEHKDDDGYWKNTGPGEHIEDDLKEMP